MTSARQILIWDKPEDPPQPPAGVDAIWNWRSFAQRGVVRSIPQHLEKHAQRLRRKYLAFVHDLGERQIAGRRVIDHLDLGDGFSLWWMTLLAEKSPLKSPAIYAAVRLLALEELLLDERPATVLLITQDRALARVVSRLCESLSINFRRQSAGSSRVRLSLRGLYDALPHAVKGLLSLRYVISRWALRAVRKPPWFAGDDAIFICSYFIHLDPSLCAQGRFHSRQWEDLPELLRAAGRRANWIQLFLLSAAVPDTATGVAWLRLFNRDASQQGCQSFLDSYLTVRNVLLAVKYWLWLLRVGWRLRAIGSIFRPTESLVWLWPILRDDWWSSMAGAVAMSNCLSIVLFEAAFAGMPRQSIGLYLCENQSWEKALLRAWRRYGHGEIIGVQHSTVPFWHLYYFDDPRSVIFNGPCALPLPDRMAANGRAAWQAFALAEYPSERLVEVEALRYLNLHEAAARRNSDFCRSRHTGTSQSGRSVVRVLVLGDLMPATMDHLLHLVQAAMRLLPPGHEFTLKPHPGLSVDLRDCPGSYAGETSEPLARILPDYDVAVSANCTSAAVDAFVVGLPVIIALDGDSLNLNPLRGQPGVHFVSTGAELAEALKTARVGPSTSTLDRAEFFFLNPDLRRWRRLLAVGDQIETAPARAS